MDAIIGHTGFVGSTLSRQKSYSHHYNSKNISTICLTQHQNVICAGAPGIKWLANSNPQGDMDSICSLIEALKSVKCEHLTLISTVDVFESPSEIDESSDVNEKNLHPYGKNRRLLEKFVLDKFPNCLIVRLPGLVGNMLKKNVLFDFKHNNNLQNIDCRSSYQFYPMENLSRDIDTANNNGVKLIHLVSTPIEVAQIAIRCFGRSFENELSSAPAQYDVRSKYANLYQSTGHYQYNSNQIEMFINKYVAEN